jgi:hypothetical protein
MKRSRKVSAALVGVLFTFVLCSGFVCTGSQLHKATIAEHDFKTTVQGFQNAEIAEFQAGHIDAALHQQIQSWILQVAEGGLALTKLIQSSNGAGALAEVNNINVTIQTLLNQGVLQIKNPTTVTMLETALLAVQTVITQVQVALTN